MLLKHKLSLKKNSKIIAIIGLLFSALLSCTPKDTSKKAQAIPLIGTWELISATTTEGDRVTVKNLTGKKMIKIINATHFAFLNHDINKEKDSLNYYVSGGGKYQLTGNKYVESLEYCTARKWEGNTFEFEVEIKGDTLIQKGIEKIEKIGVDREIIEVYLKSTE